MFFSNVGIQVILTKGIQIVILHISFLGSLKTSFQLLMKAKKDMRPFPQPQNWIYPMVKKMSSKERIQQKAEEAAAGKKKKTVKKDKETTTAIDRQKIVWKVFNDSFKEVDCFPYQEKDKAYLRAAELTRTKNKNYFVNEVCVPMVEE